MKQDSQQDSTRYVVADVHEGSIMPGSRAEMWRNVYLKKGAHIKGGVWGSEIYIRDSNVAIDESVYCRSNLMVTQESKSKSESIEFGSTVVSPDSIITKNTYCKIKFHSDIYTGKLNLNNSIVYGNIYAKDAIIKNSIVLGGIYCKDRLSLENSIVFTFKTKQLNSIENVSILSPFGICQEPFSLGDSVNALTFYNIMDHASESSGIIKLDQNDVFRVKYAEINPDNAQSDEKNPNGFPEYVHVLSIAERVLNSTEIIQHFRKNKYIIELLSLRKHLIDEQVADMKEFTKENIEKALWGIIEDKKEKASLKGGVDIHELINDYAKK